MLNKNRISEESKNAEEKSAYLYGEHAKALEALMLNPIFANYPQETQLALLNQNMLTRIHVITNALYSIRSQPENSDDRWRLINDSFNILISFFLKDNETAKLAFNNLPNEVKVNLILFLDILKIVPAYRLKCTFLEGLIAKPIPQFSEYLSVISKNKELREIVPDLMKKMTERMRLDPTIWISKLKKDKSKSSLTLSSSAEPLSSLSSQEKSKEPLQLQPESKKESKELQSQLEPKELKLLPLSPELKSKQPMLPLQVVCKQPPQTQLELKELTTPPLSPQRKSKQSSQFQSYSFFTLPLKAGTIGGATIGFAFGGIPGAAVGGLWGGTIGKAVDILAEDCCASRRLKK
jgi:hypothetical protein